MIEISGLTKQYGLNLVLRGINLRLAQGEFVTLVGANGAGKSTLLRIVATLAQPTDGTVKIGGWPLRRHADKVRRHLGLVSHQSLVYRDLSAETNLLFTAKLYQLDNPTERVREALRRVGLAARERDPVRSFSRGMVQRLTIARATLHSPDVLLLDEPYTGLDQDASQLLDNLLEREREAGRTILMITHDLLRGWHLADRVAVLSRGKIAREVQRGTLSDTDFLRLYRETVA